MKISTLLFILSISLLLPVTATSQCTTEDWDPNTCGGPYCTVYFMDPLCFSTTCHYYDWVRAICDTSGQNRSYCEAHPADTENCP